MALALTTCSTEGKMDNIAYTVTVLTLPRLQPTLPADYFLQHSSASPQPPLSQPTASYQPAFSHPSASLQPALSQPLVERDLRLAFLVERGLRLAFLVERGLRLAFLVERGLRLALLLERGLFLAFSGGERPFVAVSVEKGLIRPCWWREAYSWPL